MEKLWKFIEGVAPIVALYPKWAQGLFAVTLLFMAASLVSFLVLLPSVKARQAAGEGSAAFAITRPQDGEFITARRFSIEGRGADPRKNNVLTVHLVDARTSEEVTAQGTLSINSDHTWRYAPVEPPAPGAYDVRVDALFEPARHSRQLRINYAPGAAAPPPAAPPSSPTAKPGAPTVTIEGPPSVPLGKTTYFTVLSRNAVRGSWSIGGFQNEPVEVSPLGPSHQIYVEPTKAERVGDEFTLVFIAYGADGEQATATKRFRVVAEQPR